MSPPPDVTEKHVFHAEFCYKKRCFVPQRTFCPSPGPLPTAALIHHHTVRSNCPISLIGWLEMVTILLEILGSAAGSPLISHKKGLRVLSDCGPFKPGGCNRAIFYQYFTFCFPYSTSLPSLAQRVFCVLCFRLYILLIALRSKLSAHASIWRADLKAKQSSSCTFSSTKPSIFWLMSTKINKEVRY
jgi:hypothetical protein